MPRKRKAEPASSTPGKRKSTRRKRETTKDDIPEVFRDMLAETVASSSTVPEPEQLHIGRRKPSEEPRDDSSLEEPPPRQENASVPAPLTQSTSVQTVYDDFEDSEDDDVDFEDVDLDISDQVEDPPTQTTLQLDLSAPSNARSKTIRRRLASGAERRLRLDVHKAHLVLLLAALQCRNQWCESEQIQAMLKVLVPRKTISLLHVDDAKPQSERSRSFLKGLEEVSSLWRDLWSVTAPGSRKAHWRDNIDMEKILDELEDMIEFDDFKTAAVSRRGSRDLGAQLLCSLLRSVAVDSRLVCSLQVLPFSAVAKGQTPEKPKPSYTYAPPQDFGYSSKLSAGSKIVDSPYPVYWVEVFSASASTWIPLDPLVRKTISKPRTAFEPPASDSLNSMSYVIAFEDDGAAKDVTLRYTTNFNAKTRKSRVESTRGGEEWWSRVMAHFEKPLPEIRDELEDADFTKKAAQEGMPKNVVDFKGHPVYVLERHLRRNEVIEPRREVGKVAVGIGNNKKLENVFRRRDVHLCRTSDAWYRKGRDIREGMEALKYAAPRTRLEREEVGIEDEDIESAGMALYADYQTELYVPPPVVDGRVPRNKFGNLDVYVESMIPAGAIHVRHPLAAKAAQVLGIHFADAVTGFEFKGRQGTAIINGVVVPESQRIAMVAVVVGLQTQATDEVELERSRITLSVWRKWMRALQIRDRLEREYGGKQDDNQMHRDEPDDDEDETYRDEDAGGGFMPDPDNADAGIDAPAPYDPALGKAMTLPPLPPIPAYHEITVIESPHRSAKPKTVAITEAVHHLVDTTMESAEEVGGHLYHDDPYQVASNPDVDARQAGGDFSIDEDDVAAGGFLPEDEEDTYGGGFLPDDRETDGGGFLPDDDKDTGGGGFVPDGDEEDDKLVKTSSSKSADKLVPPAFHHTASAAAPSFAQPSDSIHVSSQLPTATETLSPATTGISKDPAHPGSPLAQINQDFRDDGEALANHPDHDQDQIRADTPTQTQSSTASSTSLLSHDPDEEEAEPEWLIDSLS